jgi:propanol-preferring alcohol dehydrogenase
VAVNAIHLDGIPAFDYSALCWERSIRSVANVTRVDVTGFLDLAATIPIVTTARHHQLDDANGALAAGEVSGSALLRIDRSSP